MNIIGRRVRHRSYGTGTIIEQTENTITVQFESKAGNSKFPYPQCFDGFLNLEDSDAAQEAEKEIKKLGEIKKERQEQYRKEVETVIAAAEMNNRKKRSRKRVEADVFESVDEFCDAYCAALREEIGFLKSNASRKYKIMDGRLVEKKGGKYVYTFETEDALNLPESSQITIWRENERVPAIVVGCEDFTIILASKAYLGDKVPGIEISAEPWKLMDSLIERLEEIRKKPTPIVEQIVCGGRDEIDAKDRKIVQGQDNAVKMSLSQPITFVWGPPGTGKTTTLAEIVLKFLEKKKRVLMVSYSNVSVDGAILKVYSKMKKKRPGVLIRYGYPRMKELLEHEYLTAYNYAINSHTDLMLQWKNLIEKRKHVSRDSQKYLQYTEELRRIKTDLSNEEKKAVKDAGFVATTVSKALADSHIYDSEFDVVIFDEASMAFVPQIVSASSLAKETFVCMGDFRQLPPIVQSNSKNCLNLDIFRYCGISEAVEYGRKHHWLCLLNEQYRMHPDIAEFAGRMMYEDLIRTAPGIEEKRERTANKAPFAGNAIGFADLTGMMSVCTKTGDHSRINLLSAFVSMSLALEKDQKQDAGIITPYHAQSRLLNAMARDIEEDSGRKITCATVHQFQGSEQDIIIYDAVDCYRMQYPGMLLTASENDYANRLFNVALTRAKGKFIGVANIGYMDKKNLSPGLMFAQMIRVQKRENSCRKDRQLFSSDRRKVEENFRIYEGHEGNSRFLQDLNFAEKEVRVDISDSPKMDQNLEDMAVELKRLKKLGLKVIVRAEKRSRLPQSLKSMAVENPFVVNPVVIIDKKTVWFGEPLSEACFMVEGQKLPVSFRPVIRFEGKHTAAALYSFLEMDQTTDRSRAAEKDRAGKPVNDNFESFVLMNTRCPSCGKPMMLKKSRKGKYFLSCTGYPVCSETKFVEVDLVEGYLNRNGGTGQHCGRCGYSLEAKLGYQGIYVQCCGAEHHKYSLDEI